MFFNLDDKLFPPFMLDEHVSQPLSMLVNIDVDLGKNRNPDVVWPKHEMVMVAIDFYCRVDKAILATISLSVRSE